MKTIYTAVMERLKTQVPALKWIEMDIGQLNQQNPPVAFPCALVGIKLTRCQSVTDSLQDCEARISVRLAFNTQLNTAAAVPDAARNTSLTVYDTIAAVYAALQGWGTDNFDSLSRTAQGDEPPRNGLFIYKLEFSTSFEDETANQ